MEKYQKSEIIDLTAAPELFKDGVKINQLFRTDYFQNSFRPTFRGTARIGVFDAESKSMTVLNGAGAATKFDLNEYSPALGASDVDKDAFRFFASAEHEKGILESAPLYKIFTSFEKDLQISDKTRQQEFAQIKKEDDKISKLPFNERFDAEQDWAKNRLGEFKISREELFEMASKLRARELGELAVALTKEGTQIQNYDPAQFDAKYFCFDATVEPELCDKARAKTIPLPAAKTAPAKVGIMTKLKNAFKKSETTIGEN